MFKLQYLPNKTIHTLAITSPGQDCRKLGADWGLYRAEGRGALWARRQSITGHVVCSLGIRGTNSLDRSSLYMQSTWRKAEGDSGKVTVPHLSLPHALLENDTA